MSNRFFNLITAWRLIRDQFARSRWVNDRLDEIAAGFLSVQNEVDTLLTDPLLQGNARAPTTMTRVKKEQPPTVLSAYFFAGAGGVFAGAGGVFAATCEPMLRM